jgi:hypothetical protein
MGLGLLLFLILIGVLVAVLPAWPHSKSWGYGPTSVAGLVTAVLLAMIVMGCA